MKKSILILTLGLAGFGNSPFAKSLETDDLAAKLDRNAFRSDTGTGDHGGDPDANQFASLAKIFSDWLKQVEDPNLSYFYIDEMAKNAKSLQTSLDRPDLEDRIVFTTEMPIDFRGVEKPSVFNIETKVIRAHRDTWHTYSLQEKVELVAIELSGISGVPNRYTWAGDILDENWVYLSHYLDAAGTRFVKGPKVQAEKEPSRSSIPINFGSLVVSKVPLMDLSFETTEPGALGIVYRCLTENEYNVMFENGSFFKVSEDEIEAIGEEYPAHARKIHEFVWSTFPPYARLKSAIRGVESAAADMEAEIGLWRGKIPNIDYCDGPSPELAGLKPDWKFKPSFLYYSDTNSVPGAVVIDDSKNAALAVCKSKMVECHIVSCSVSVRRVIAPYSFEGKYSYRASFVVWGFQWIDEVD